MSCQHCTAAGCVRQGSSFELLTLTSLALPFTCPPRSRAAPSPAPATRRLMVGTARWPTTASQRTPPQTTSSSESSRSRQHPELCLWVKPQGHILHHPSYDPLHLHHLLRALLLRPCVLHALVYGHLIPPSFACHPLPLPRGPRLPLAAELPITDVYHAAIPHSVLRNSSPAVVRQSHS